jgi:hypothetical protein
MGHVVGWTKAPSMPLDLVRELSQYAHPLRNPKKYEAMYRREHARLQPPGPQVPAGAGPSVGNELTHP